MRFLFLSLRHIVKGIEVSSTLAVLAIALVLGVINALLRPLIILVTLPINVLTLGVFTLFINGVVVPACFPR